MKKNKTYKTDLQSRKPTKLTRSSGVLSYRYATRALVAVSYQLPPRKTREEPEAGPSGLFVGLTS